MEDLTQRIVTRLREDPSSLSRNRNFLTFEEPAARRALHVVRYLGSLERDIMCANSRPVEVKRQGSGNRLQIRLEFPLLKGTRVSYLSEEEFAILCENPEVRRALAQKEIA